MANKGEGERRWTDKGLWPTIYQQRLGARLGAKSSGRGSNFTCTFKLNPPTQIKLKLKEMSLTTTQFSFPCIVSLIMCCRLLFLLLISE
jgi:hypothetical protein